MLMFLQTILNQLVEFRTMLIKLLGPERAEFYMSVINNQELFIEETVHELLWGYTNPLFEVLMSLGLTDEPLMSIEVNAITCNNLLEIIASIKCFALFVFMMLFSDIILCFYDSRSIANRDNRVTTIPRLTYTF